MVVGQKIALGRVHRHKTITIDVTDTELVIHCDDGLRTVRRATDQPVTRIKAHRPRKSQPLAWHDLGRDAVGVGQPAAVRT